MFFLSIQVLQKFGNVESGTDTSNAKLEITSGTPNASGLRFTNITASSLISGFTRKPLGVEGNEKIITVSDIVASTLTSNTGNHNHSNISL